MPRHFRDNCGSPPVTVSRGLALIADGALDGDDASVEQLAEKPGMGERQLRRLFQQHLGASPVAVAQTRRVLFAEPLIAQTTARARNTERKSARSAGMLTHAG